MRSSIKKIVLALLVLCVSTALFAKGADGRAIKIGITFSDYETERWLREAEMFEELYTEKGIEVVIQNANHDPKMQNDQIDNMITQGCHVIIVVAQDGDAAATAVDAAAAEGVKVIAYDRLIKSANLAAYITFDNVEVGRAQARTILEVVDSGNFMLLGGSPDDNNAHLFRRGQREIIDPLVDSGQITIVGDQWVETWSPQIATTKMENMLTAANNQVDAVLSPNDGCALGALQALKAQGLGDVPLTGQDATDAGLKSIVDGELYMTVLKNFANMVPFTVDQSIRLAQGKSVDLTNYSLADLTGSSMAGTVPCLFLPVVSITADNLYEEVFVNNANFPANYDVVYSDVPASQRPR